LDYTTGDPISNLQVKRSNYKDSSNGATYLVNKDSFLTDAGGNCNFGQSESDDYISWSSASYFDDYLHHVPGTKLPRTSSLNIEKTEGDTRYYLIKLFPKIEVTIHIKQVTPFKSDSTSYGLYLVLSSLAYNNGDSRNEISQVTEQNFVPQCNSCFPYTVGLKENVLIDIKIKGFLVKNFFNTLKYSVNSIEDFHPGIIKQGKMDIENRIIGSQTEILLTF
jgi:hypothetical protein